MIGILIRILDDASDRSLSNLPVQATGAMVSNLPCTSFHVRWRGLTPELFIPQHDEIIVEARDGIEDQVKAFVKKSMGEAFQGIIPEVPFVVEIRVAEAWG